MDLIYITTHLNTHEKCIKYLEERRWNGTPKCPYCGSSKSSAKGSRYTCLGCSNSYRVTVGTMFENSNLPLNKWFIAIALILSAKKGISSLQLSRDLSVNKNTAWLMQMKIKRVIGSGRELNLFPDLATEIDQNDCHETVLKSDSLSKEEATCLAINFSGSPAFWSLFKRAIIGQYHRLSNHYVYRYLDELRFKQNHKTIPDRGFHELLGQSFSRSFAKF